VGVGFVFVSKIVLTPRGGGLFFDLGFGLGVAFFRDCPHPPKSPSPRGEGDFFVPLVRDGLLVDLVFP